MSLTIVVRQFLPDQIGAHPDERDDLGRRGLHLDVDEFPLDGQDAEPHLRQGVLHLFFREGLLFARDGLLVAALHAVDERRPREDSDELELPLRRHQVGLLLGDPQVLGFDDTLDRLPSRGETLDSELRH
jgi:hypothetical protein